MACRYQERRSEIDWQAREEELRKIAEWAKKHSQKDGFHCVIGVSGGKDSHFQAFHARDRLGLKALLVTNAPDTPTRVGRENLENLLQHGFDLISIRVNPRVMRAVTRQGFYEYGNPVKASEYSLWASAYIIALKFRIPLVVQGENPAITLGISGGQLPTGGDALQIRLHNTLSGGNASDWLEEGIEARDLQFLQFPHQEVQKSKLKAVFLNYYAREWAYTGNTEFAVARGLMGTPDHDPAKTGKLSPYTSVDSDAHILNQMIKYYKFGFGFVTDEVCYRIREDGMTREEGISLIEQYDGRCDERYIRDFCDYIGITRAEFSSVLDRFVNRDLFRMDPETGRWLPKFRVGSGIDH
jgi:N-acetyl sugar amidotransferase